MPSIGVYGPSGHGKSTGIRPPGGVGLNPDESFIICSDMKPLPFRGSKVLFPEVLDAKGGLDITKSRYFTQDTFTKPDGGTVVRQATNAKAVLAIMKQLDEIELLAKLAKMAIKVKKNYPCCQILLGQLNDKIENPFRLTNQALHYPTKTDVHGSKQLYWACDYVGIIHRPEELGIALYGRHNYPTQDLIAFHLIKARNGKIGLVRLRQQFAQGKIIEWA